MSLGPPNFCSSSTARAASLSAMLSERQSRSASALSRLVSVVSGEDGTFVKERILYNGKLVHLPLSGLMTIFVSLEPMDLSAIFRTSFLSHGV